VERASYQAYKAQLQAFWDVINISYHRNPNIWLQDFTIDIQTRRVRQKSDEIYR